MARYDDFTGAWVEEDQAPNFTTGDNTINNRPDPSAVSSPVTPNFDASGFLANLNQRDGHTKSNNDASDLAAIQGKKAEDLPQFLRDLTAQSSIRAQPTASDGGSGGDADTNGDGRLDAGWVGLGGPEGRNVVKVGDTGNNSGWASPNNAGWKDLPSSVGAKPLDYWTRLGINPNVGAFAKGPTGYTATGGTPSGQAAPVMRQGQPAGYQGLEYWQALGKSPIGPNGSLAAGWTRTANGYAYGGAGSGTSPSGSAPRFENTSHYFTDPTQRLVEDTALGRLQELQNPSEGSGTNLYESYAKQLVDTLKGPAFSASDEAVLHTQAFDMLERDRTSTKQRFMEELSRRGITPSSGPALSGLLDIDKHYDQIRGQVTNQMQLAKMETTRNQRFQALDVLGSLAGSENTRLNQSLNVSRVPYEMGRDAFADANQAVGAGGSPGQNVSTAIQLATAIQNNMNMTSQQRAYALQALYEVIGGLT